MISSAATAIIALALAFVAWLLLAPVLRARRHRRAAAAPLAPSRVDAVERNVPIRAQLPLGLRDRLDGLVAAFVAEKTFVGCNGLTVTDEMRVTIAAHACVLVLGRPHDLYPSLQSILVYPTPFWVEEEDEDESGLVTRQRRVLAGQAWDASRIILSWEDVVAAGAAHDAGYNVVLHEFAHHLDYEAVGLAEPEAGPRRPLENWTLDLRDQFLFGEKAFYSVIHRVFPLRRRKGGTRSFRDKACVFSSSFCSAGVDKLRVSTRSLLRR